MSGFQFPPPPPPPPKATLASENQYHQPEAQGRGQGRGRGRGRGFDRGGRGRGGRGGSSNFQPQHHQQAHHQQILPPPLFHSMNGLPPGTYVNPAFQGNLNPLPPQNFSSNGLKPATQSPGRTIAGHKRKLDALRGPSFPDAKKSEKPETPTGPSVPSFGAPLGSRNATFPPTASDRNEKRTQHTKRNTNVLGLTPNGEPQYSSSESDDEDAEVDEEAMYAEVGTSLTFEHNGTVMSLSSAAELAAWKAERAKNFPTQARMVIKQNEKRQAGAERQRLLLEASKALRIARRPLQEPKPLPVLPQESKLEKAKKELAAKSEALVALRKKVAKSQAKVALSKANDADDQAGTVELPLGCRESPPRSSPSQQESSLLNQAQDDKVADAIQSSDESSSSESSVISSDSSESDSDGPPEVISSKHSKELPGTKNILCRDYVASGRCRDGDSCRFKHELPERGTGSAYREAAQKEQNQREQQRKAENDLHDAKLMESRAENRKTIFQRLQEQEHAGEDLLALHVIKALGKMHFFAEVTTPDKEA